MSASYILPDEPVPDFHARVTRRGRARALRAPRNRQLVAKRLGVLLVAMAVPALAAPDSFQGPQQITQPALIVAPMGFETPGESFPGSAFYYLEDTPPLMADADMPAFSQDQLALSGSGVTPDTDFNTGPVARSLRITGSGSDHARAQNCLTQAIYYEAASESDAGQRAVAQVVLNRVAHPTFPRSVCGVVFQGSERTTGCQFSFTCDGSLARKPNAVFWNRAGRIARQALAGAVYAPVGLSTHYHTLAVNPHWASSLDQVTVIGAHQFYRWRGSAGTLAAFSARYAGAEPATERRAGQIATPVSMPAPALVTADIGSASASIANPANLAGSSPAPIAPRTNNLPVGGGIRSEYAQSGIWRASPGRASTGQGSAAGQVSKPQ